ncbi:MAG: hypothetical protein IT184_00835 [Acidobacteria bacterium]|nr:hypothetical protein [Acidobacteriota bacterium]
MTRNGFLLASAMAALILAACDSGSSLTSPSGTGGDAAAAADGSTLKIAAPTLISPINGAQAAGPSIVLTVSNVSGTYTTFPVTYEVEVRDPAGTIVAHPTFPKGNAGSSSYALTTPLAFDTTHTWRARATYSGRVGPWSSTGAFRTGQAAFLSGSSVLDPLTTGRTVGKQRGGHFVAGQGWQADTRSDGIDYDIATCASCRLEFDVTNVGNGLGNGADLKFISMGDAAMFGDFNSFRDHPWKMHLEQRGDGDGKGMKLIWRNGAVGDGDPGDHLGQVPSNGPAWSASRVFHFVIQWGRTSYTVSVDGQVWFSGSFAAPYAPPNHRISLGTYPRSETLAGAIWRNVTVTPQ